MKISKSKLKKIIKEELNNVLRESHPSWHRARVASREDQPQSYTGDVYTPPEPEEGTGGSTPGELGDEARSMTSGEAEMEQTWDPGMEQQAQKIQRWDRVNTGEGGKMRRLVNAMLRNDEIIKDVWRSARRALYQSGGVEKAKVILDVAHEERMASWRGDRSSGRGFGATPGGMADLATRDE